MKQPRPPKKKTSAPVVLCVDPGFTNLGWGIVGHVAAIPFVAAMGVLRTAPSPKKTKTLKSADNARRIQESAVLLQGLVLSHSVDMIVYESFSLPRQASKMNAVKIGFPYGILGMLSVAHDLACEQVTPQAVKKALCGVMNASKDDVEAAVRAQFTDTASRLAEAVLCAQVPAKQRNHAWDALAAYFAVKDSDVLRALRRGARAR